MESMRKTVRAFCNQATIHLTEALHKSNALPQKATFQHQRITRVEMENVELKAEVEKLEKACDEKRILLEQVGKMDEVLGDDDLDMLESPAKKPKD